MRSSVNKDMDIYRHVLLEYRCACSSRVNVIALIVNVTALLATALLEYIDLQASFQEGSFRRDK